MKLLLVGEWITLSVINNLANALYFQDDLEEGYRS